MPLYCKYRKDFNNTLISVSASPQQLGFNEKEVYVETLSSISQPYYNHRYDGRNVVANDQKTISHYLNYINLFGGVAHDNALPYSASTANIIDNIVLKKFFFKEKEVIQTTTTDTLTDYDSVLVTMPKGQYKITFSISWSSSMSNRNATFEFRRNGINMFPIQYIDRVSTGDQRMFTSIVKMIQTVGGASNHTFSIAFGTAGGTLTAFYSSISIERMQ